MKGLAAAAPLLLLTMATAGGAEMEHRRIAFENAGRQIRLEMYAPKNEDRLPAVILLHGAGGWFMDGPAIRRVAKALAQEGYRAFCLRYFDQTGTAFAKGEAINQGFSTWRGTLNAAVNTIARRQDVDPDRMALFGYSLGGFLSFAQAAHDRRIKAVVEQAGAIPDDRIPQVQHLPPVLILHGEADRRIPVGNAAKLESLLKRLGTPCEKKIYAGEGHVLSRQAQTDAVARMTQFLRRHL